MKVGYARVSTGEQTTDLQVQALKAAGCEHILQETASGVSAKRPMFDELLKYVRSGDVVVIWRLDRLGRSTRQLLETAELLNKRGIDLQSLTEEINTATAGGRLTYAIFGALAQFERDLISQRTVAGLEAARARGRVGGRPRALSEDDILLARALLREPGVPVWQVAETLNCSLATLYRYVPGGRRSITS